MKRIRQKTKIVTVAIHCIEALKLVPYRLFDDIESSDWRVCDSFKMRNGVKGFNGFVFEMVWIRDMRL